MCLRLPSAFACSCKSREQVSGIMEADLKAQQTIFMTVGCEVINTIAM